LTTKKSIRIDCLQIPTAMEQTARSATPGVAFESSLPPVPAALRPSA